MPPLNFARNIEGAVIKFFEDNHLNAKSEWLQACLDYHISTNPQSSFQQVKEFAIEQWKLGNLREIGVPTLPNNNLKNIRVTELKGIYTVQVDKFWDRANSNYNQYKDLKGELGDEQQDDENPEVNDINLTQWGKGPSAGETKRKLKPRRLLMEICDGLTELKALEWKPIQELSGMVFPGAKLVIKGPVVCRNGILMLGPDHVKLYGGEVEEILFSNAMENLLADSLGYPTNPDPYKDKTSTLPPPRRPQAQFRKPNLLETHPPKSLANCGNRAMITNRNNNIFNNPVPRVFGANSNSTLSHQDPPKIIENTAPDWDDDMDDFELSAEDLQAIEKVEKAGSSQPETRKRQTPSPVDFDLEDDALMELERIEYQQQSKAAKRPLLAAPSAPEAKISKPPVIARIPPVQQPVKIAPPQSKTPQPNSKQPSLLNFLTKTSAKKPPPVPPRKVKFSAKPFIYLRQLKSTNRKKAVIKATVISILRKLSTSNQKWSLLAKVADPTDFLDVELGNKVLSKMIGMKCKDFVEMRADKETKGRVVQGLKKSLIDCDCLMVVRFPKNKPPKVVKLKSVTRIHLRQLRTRQTFLDKL